MKKETELEFFNLEESMTPLKLLLGKLVESVSN